MKRTPLRPSLKGLSRVPLGSARTPARQPHKPMKRSTSLKSRGKKRKCWAHLRDEKYKAFVRSMPCILSYQPSHICRGKVEFAHIDNEGNGGADYANGLPLCGVNGHRLGKFSYHVLGKDSFPAHWGFGTRDDMKAKARLLANIYETVVPVVAEYREAD